MEAAICSLRVCSLLSHLPHLFTFHGDKISATVVSVSEPKKHKMRNEAAGLGNILLQQIEYGGYIGIMEKTMEKNPQPCSNVHVFHLRYTKVEVDLMVLKGGLGSWILILTPFI